MVTVVRCTSKVTSTLAGAEWSVPWSTGRHLRSEGKGGRGMDVYSISDAGIKQRHCRRIEQLLKQSDDVIWVECPLPAPEDNAVRVIRIP